MADNNQKNQDIYQKLGKLFDNIETDKELASLAIKQITALKCNENDNKRKQNIAIIILCIIQNIFFIISLICTVLIYNNNTCIGLWLYVIICFGLACNIAFTVTWVVKDFS